MARYKGGSRAKTRDELFTADLPYYVINSRLKDAEQYSDKLLRQEYTRLRDIAQKRLKRMEGKPEAEFVLSQHPEGFPKLKDLSDRSELTRALADLRNFMTAKRSSISGIRNTIEETAASISETAGVEVPKEQLANFGKFINAVKKELGLKSGTYETQYVVNVWSDLQNKGKLSKNALKSAIERVVEDFANEPEKKITKKTLTESVAKYMNMLTDPGEWNETKDEQSARIAKNLERAERVAANITEYFTLDRIDKRSQRQSKSKRYRSKRR